MISSVRPSIERSPAAAQNIEKIGQKRSFWGHYDRNIGLSALPSTSIPKTDTLFGIL
jgi:hypothetical protein